MKQHREEKREPEKPDRKVWWKTPDFLLGVVIAIVLFVAASWYVNNPNSLGFWRSFP